MGNERVQTVFWLRTGERAAAMNLKKFVVS
jgi:hypothetical protein